MPPHSLTNFKVQKHYQNKSKFKCVYSRNNLPKIKDRAFVINLDQFKSIRTHWVVLHVNSNRNNSNNIVIIITIIIIIIIIIIKVYYHDKTKNYY